MKLDDLRLALDNLREHWPQRWPGLARVLEGCLRQLGHDGRAPLAHPARAIHACMLELAALIEADGVTRQAKGLEPAYHNRLHMADAVVALTALLLETRKDQIAPGAQPSHREWLAMLAMLGHDFLHDGSVNTSPGELEQRSVRQLQPLMAKHGLAAPDCELVKNLILLTDPTRVTASHQAIAGRRFGIDDADCLAVLVQEADILASSLPGVGQELTRQLAREWALFDTQRAQQVLTDTGRLCFLRFAALLSSPASQRLGLGAVRAGQIASLDAALSARVA